MNLAAAAIATAERLPLPDPVLRFGISRLVDRTRRLLAESGGPTDTEFARSMTEWPIAESGGAKVVHGSGGIMLLRAE